MAITKVLIAPNKILLQKSSEVKDFDRKIAVIAQNMIDTMHEKSALGLAAIQIGIPKRIIVVNIPEEYEEECAEECTEKYNNINYEMHSETIILINPIITYQSTEMVKMEEGCLSVPKQRVTLNRSSKISVTFQDLNGKKVKLNSGGWLARCILHEIDHLNGILLYQRLSRLKQDIHIKKAQKIKSNLIQNHD